MHSQDQIKERKRGIAIGRRETLNTKSSWAWANVKNFETKSLILWFFPAISIRRCIMIIMKHSFLFTSGSIRRFICCLATCRRTCCQAFTKIRFSITSSSEEKRARLRSMRNQWQNNRWLQKWSQVKADGSYLGSSLYFQLKRRENSCYFFFFWFTKLNKST